MTDPSRLVAWLDALPFAAMSTCGVPDVGVPGVRGVKSGVPVPQANLVGRARLARADVEPAIRAVQQVFDGLPYTWVVGPLSQPPDLGDRLLLHGLQLGESLEGLAYRDWDRPLMRPSTVRVRSASADELTAHAAPLAAAYGMGMTADALASSMRGVLAPTGGAGPATVGYLAWEAGSEEPVGWGTLTWLQTDTALLNGSATVPAARGRGVYRALTAARLEDAHHAGAAVVLVSAVVDTSAPICRRLGFQPVCHLQHYLGNVAARPVG